MSSDLENSFPNLVSTEYKITSPIDLGYNCIAWAAGDQNNWWWPDEDEIFYWPVDAPRENTIEAFIQAYSLYGYSICENSSLEEGFEKIALYADVNGEPTHAARQLSNGKWTSKLGECEDIEHELEGLFGDVYGSTAQFLKRPIISS